MGKKHPQRPVSWRMDLNAGSSFIKFLSLGKLSDLSDPQYFHVPSGATFADHF